MTGGIIIGTDAALPLPIFTFSVYLVRLGLGWIKILNVVGLEQCRKVLHPLFPEIE